MRLRAASGAPTVVAPAQAADPPRGAARSVANALYDPKLELVWLEGESLRVLDLRKPGSNPIPIVRHWPGTSSFSIVHRNTTISDNEPCDVGDAGRRTSS